MSQTKFWVDFDNGDICRADGIAIATIINCDATPDDLEELDEILKAHGAYPNCLPIGESRVVELEEKERKLDKLQEQVQTLREAVEDARKELEAQAAYFGSHHLDPENNLFRILRKLESTLESTKPEGE